MKNYFLCTALILFSQLVTTGQPVSPTREADSLFMNLNYKAALIKYEDFMRTNAATATPLILARLGYSYHMGGNYDAAINAYNQSIEKKAPPNLRPFLFSRLVMAYSLKMDKGKAMVYLDSAAANLYSNLYELENNTDYTLVRNENKFMDLLKSARLRALPCNYNKAARDFDFWIGEWDVYNNQFPNQLVGSNNIQNVSGGCTLLENWQALNSYGSGKSFNYYDTATRKWTQHWIGAGGGRQFYTDGVYSDGAMRFKFTTTGAQGQPVIGNFIFYNLGPDKVRQYQDFSIDGGKTFQVSYDFLYIRKGIKTK